MDPALVKERDAFLKRAKATPTVEKRKLKSNENDDRKPKKPKPAPPKPQDPMDYKVSHGSSQNKFAVLSKIVLFLKTKHQKEENEPLTLSEVLDETKQLDITSKMKHWLSTESLLSNPKIAVLKEDGTTKFCFKPKFNIHDKKSLVKLLRNYDLHGRGGILFEDIEESLPNVERVLKGLSDYIIMVTRPQDKKKVLFYNDRYCRFSVDEHFQKLWRSVAVEGLDDQKIEEHLNKHGITSMEAAGLRKVSSLPRRKKGKQKGKNFKKHNDHLDGVLKDYTENPATSL